MLDTTYYNERLLNFRERSEFSDAVASLIDAIDAFDSAVIACVAAEAERTGSPISVAQEALGDYIQRGSGSIVHGIANIYRAIWNMGVWVLKMIKKMVVFAVKGFRGTVGGAIRNIEKMGPRIGKIQQKRLGEGIHVKTCARVNEICDEHSRLPNIKLNGGKIAAAKQQFIASFNANMKDDAKVNGSFVMLKPPGTIHNATLASCGGTSADVLKTAGEALLEAEKKLKERLREMGEQGTEVKKIISKIQDKGYRDKYVKGAGTTQVLMTAYNAAILANDLKYLAVIEDKFVKMIYVAYKASQKVVVDENETDEVVDNSEPKKDDTQDAFDKLNVKNPDKDTTITVNPDETGKK